MVKDAFVIEVKPSVWLLRYLSVGHSFFLIIVALSPITWPLQGLLGLILLLSFIFYTQSHYKKTGRYTVKKLTLSEGEWSVSFGDGYCLEGLSLRQSFVMPQLVILYFKPASSWRTRSVYLAADQVDIEVLRQLRVYCRDQEIYLQ
jgi:hypothetical protein